MKRNVICTGLQPRLTDGQPGCDPRSPVPSHDWSVSAPRSATRSSCRPVHSLSYFTPEGLSRILIESRMGKSATCTEPTRKLDSFAQSVDQLLPSRNQPTTNLFLPYHRQAGDILSAVAVAHTATNRGNQPLRLLRRVDRTPLRDLAYGRLTPAASGRSPPLPSACSSVA